VSAGGTEPRVLLLDIETLPNLVTSWGLRVDGYLSHENIREERYIACAAWKWLGEPRIHSAVANIGAPSKDKPVLQKIHATLEKADAVIGHNGDKFDIPWCMSRFIMQGFPPPKPVVQIDTKKLAKDKFYFNSNRLDYLASRLGLGNKIHTDFDLWLRVMDKAPGALEEMVTYNKHDVTLLEGVYLKMRPYVVAKLNRALFKTSAPAISKTCPACGEEMLQVMARNYLRVTTRTSLKCRSCGHWCYRINDLPR